MYALTSFCQDNHQDCDCTPHDVNLKISFDYYFYALNHLGFINQKSMLLELNFRGINFRGVKQNQPPNIN